jgi:hypothetical protein
MNGNELERIWKETIVEATDEIHEKLRPGEPMFRSRFEPTTSRTPLPPSLEQQHVRPYNRPQISSHLLLGLPGSPLLPIGL